MAGKLDRIIRGDALRELGKLEAGSVDLVFADPPFNIGYDYDEYDDRKSAEDYLGWSKQWIEGVIRVLRPTGTFWLAIGDEYAAELKVMATRELGLTCRSWVVWYYTFGVHCKTKFSRSHAHLFHFVRDEKLFTFNDMAVRVPSARQLVYGDKRANPKGRVPDDTFIIRPAPHDSWILRPQDLPDGFSADSDTWYFPRVCGTFSERMGFHGCQMPEQLLGRIIRACSDEGALVLDPFAGSGTTLAVAKKLDRRHLGIELSKQYAEQIRLRLKRITPGDALDGAEDPLTSVANTANGTSRTPDGQRVKRNGTQRRRVRSPGGTAVLDDTARGIIEAFQGAHQGFSTDWLLSDREMNAEFADRCERLSLPGTRTSWNECLIGMRKTTKLPKNLVTRRPTLDRQKLRECEFASEIALSDCRKTPKISLDDVMCDPDLAAVFDSLASEIAPGCDPCYYRWAAFGLRKRARAACTYAARFSKEWVNVRLAPRVTVSEIVPDDLPNRGAVYVLRGPDSLGRARDFLYVGETPDVRKWVDSRRETGTFGKPIFKREGGTSILFQYVRRALGDDARLRGLQSHYIAKERPSWNFPKLGSTAA